MTRSASKSSAGCAANRGTSKAARALVHTAILAVQGKVEVLARTLKNDYGNYNYVPIDAYYENVVPLAREEGLSWIINLDESEIIADGAAILVRVSVDLMHKSGLVIEGYSRFPMVHPLMGGQTSGAVQSYADKMFMRNIFKVPTTEEDSDAYPNAMRPRKLTYREDHEMRRGSGTSNRQGNQRTRAAQPSTPAPATAPKSGRSPQRTGGGSPPPRTAAEGLRGGMAVHPIDAPPPDEIPEHWRVDEPLRGRSPAITAPAHPPPPPPDEIPEHWRGDEPLRGHAPAATPTARTPAPPPPQYLPEARQQQLEMQVSNAAQQCPTIGGLHVLWDENEADIKRCDMIRQARLRAVFMTRKEIITAASPAVVEAPTPAPRQGAQPLKRPMQFPQQAPAAPGLLKRTLRDARR